MQFENHHVNTACKYGNAESLKDEFKAFQAKVQDHQVLKSDDSIKDSAQ